MVGGGGGREGAGGEYGCDAVGHRTVNRSEVNNFCKFS